MQKYLKILEKNVHWIALGLGAVYLLWMAYAYVISTPVSVKVGSKEFVPEHADEDIYTGKGKDLERKINHTDKIAIPTFDVLTPYLAALDEKDKKVPEVTINWAGTRGEILDGPNDIDLGPKGGTKVTVLPKLPKPVYVNDSHGITVVLPAGTAQPMNNGVQQIALTGTDTRWESLRFKIPVAALSSAFTDSLKAAERQQLFVTRVLQVHLFRQEQLPNGQWSEPALVKIDVEGLPPYPGDKVSPKTDRKPGFEYKTAAAKLAKEILTPAFPTVVPGSPVWYAPGQPEPQRVRPAGGGPAAPGAAAPPAPVIPTAIPRMPVFPGAVAPAMAPGANPANTAQVGEGEFDVTTLTEDKEIIVHDLTVQDGKIYRYALQYKLANSVWDTTNIAKNELTDVFALVSEMSDWTPEIRIKRHTRVFVTAARPNLVTFTVFEWKAGRTNKTSAEAAPGDTVKDCTVVDIRPDPVRHGETVVLLLEDGNQLKAHSKRSDEGSPEFEELKAMAAGDAAPVPK